jgi:hypothetical protein
MSNHLLSADDGLPRRLGADGFVDLSGDFSANVAGRLPHPFQFFVEF